MIGEDETQRGKLKGYIFEVVIRQLLKKNGWSLIKDKKRGRIKIHNDYNIEIKGRGTWHQIDTPAIFIRGIPFIFPLRLLAEMKFQNKEIGKDKIREYIGVIKDISENYFIDHTRRSKTQKRYTDVGVYFSALGFQKEAVHLAFAHGIKTISYLTNPEMKEIKETIMDIEENNLSIKCIGKNKQYRFMKALELALIDPDTINIFFKSNIGVYNKKENILKLSKLLREKRTNFFGMTSTGVLLHFISQDAFPINLFQDTDEQRCTIHYEEIFPPEQERQVILWMQFSNDQENRKFYFDVPPSLERVMKRGSGVLKAKEKEFEKISILYFFRKILRVLNIRIDKEWLQKLKDRKIG